MTPSAVTHRSSEADPNRRMSRTRGSTRSRTSACRARRRASYPKPVATRLCPSSVTDEQASRRPSRKAPAPAIADLRHADARARARRPRPLRRQPPAPIETAQLGKVVQVIHRAVDRIDDPAHPGCCRYATSLPRRASRRPVGASSSRDRSAPRTRCPSRSPRRSARTWSRSHRISPRRPRRAAPRPRAPCRARDRGATADRRKPALSLHRRCGHRIAARAASAARTAGSRRAGSTRPRLEYRCARRRRIPVSRSPVAATSIVPDLSLTSASPETVNSSSPVRPSDSRVSPCGNCSGSTPIPIRLERWMRSYDSAMTARTPSSAVPLAAQSREEPEPYSLPASTTSGVAVRGVLLGRVVDRRLLTVGPGRWRVTPPSVPGASWLRSRMLAKVPRIITSWLPRREP